MDVKLTLDFLAELTSEAITEGRKGNVVLVNKLGANPAVAHYMNQVALLKVWTPEQWSQNFAPFMQEANTLREAYTREQGTEITVNDLAAKLAEVSKQLTEAVAEIQVLKSAQPAAKKSAKLIKETAEPEPEADATAEAETEETTDEPTETKADTEGE